MRPWVAFALVCSCATAAPRRSDKLGCLLPPERVADFIQVECQEFPDLGAIGCTYLGWREDRLCASIVESTDCGKWSVGWTTCDVAGVRVMVPEDEELPPPPSDGVEDL